MRARLRAPRLRDQEADAKAAPKGAAARPARSGGHQDRQRRPGRIRSVPRRSGRPASIDILEEGGFDEDKQYQGRRISLDFKDADIAHPAPDRGGHD